MVLRDGAGNLYTVPFEVIAEYCVPESARAEVEGRLSESPGEVQGYGGLSAQLRAVGILERHDIQTANFPQLTPAQIDKLPIGLRNHLM